MKHIKEEYKKIEIEDPFKPVVKKKQKQRNDKPLPDDSVSDITDLEEDEILAKYFKKRASRMKQLKRQQARERLTAQSRLLGDQVPNRHISLDHIPKSDNGKQKGKDDTVVLELRKPEIPVEKCDEDLSAHQFSVKEQSIQADSEERLDLEMQATKVEEQQLANPLLI